MSVPNINNPKNITGNLSYQIFTISFLFREFINISNRQFLLIFNTIGGDSRNNGNIQTFLKDKLDDYLYKSEVTKQVLKEKYCDKDCTFAPRINEANSYVISHKCKV